MRYETQPIPETFNYACDTGTDFARIRRALKLGTGALAAVARVTPKQIAAIEARRGIVPETATADRVRLALWTLADMWERVEAER